MTFSEGQSKGLRGINSSIYDDVFSDQEIIRHFELANVRSDIKTFLVETTFRKRRRLAISISKKSLERHGKQDIDAFVSKMAEIESGVQRFNRNLRDHVNHSVYVYLLGLLFIKNLNLVRLLDPLSWKIVSLLHDIGYPLQLFSASIKEYLDLLYKYRLEASGLNVPIDFAVSINGLEALKFSNEDAFCTIERRLKEWNIHLDIQKINDEHQRQGKINHGILSALIALNIIDSLYAKKNPEHAASKIIDKIDWGKDCFNTQILDAVSAICVHDILDEFDTIAFEDSPIAYLLVLCDNLQQWNRYMPRRRTYSPHSVQIEFDRNNIVCKLALPKSRFKESDEIFNNKLRSQVFNLRLSPKE